MFTQYSANLKQTVELSKVLQNKINQKLSSIDSNLL